jgi:hypothetical protein
MKRISLILLAVVALGGLAYAGVRLYPKISGATIESRLAEFGVDADKRWKPYFAQAGVAYPAKRYTFVALKDTKSREVFAGDATGPMKFVRALPILAASGEAGPKLKRGDNQVPEGVYAVESLNPRSLYHVALRVNYPNADDRARAKAEGRTNLGGDIMIHGSNGSVGCLAMGDPVSEDLFTLAARSGKESVTLLFCPTDFRKDPKFAPPAGSPAWMAERYADLKARLGKL